MRKDDLAWDTETMNRTIAHLSSIPVPVGMEHSDFAIGDIFLCGAKVWRCADIGTRVIVADVLCRGDNGKNDIAAAPEPQLSRKAFFDEYDVNGCSAIYVIDDDVMDWLRAKGKGGISSKLTQALKAAMLRDS